MSCIKKYGGVHIHIIGCYLLSLLRPMLPSVGGFAISSDGYFYSCEVPALYLVGTFP